MPKNVALKTGFALFHTPQVKHRVPVVFCLWREVRELAVPVRELFCRDEGNHEQQEVLPGAGRCPTVQTVSSALGSAAGRGVGALAACATLAGCPFLDQLVWAEVSASAQQGANCA